MVCGRVGSSAEAEKRREAALGRGHKAILGGISREKPRRDPGTLEYDSQQKRRLALRGRGDIILGILNYLQTTTCNHPLSRAYYER